MNILLIGGSGLISTAISRQLLEQGHQVTLFNRGTTPVRLPEGYREIHGDRKDYADFEATFGSSNYDVVVDMVAFHPDHVASAIRAFSGRVQQYIFCSTVCVYSGPVTQMPTPETEPYHSIGNYGREKAQCELLLQQERERSGFPYTIMRPSHSYGEGGGIIRPFGPANSFIPRLRAERPIVVQGDGNSAWAACHVDDVAKGFIGTMLNPRCLGEAYNITGDEWMSWNMYHEQVAEVVGGVFKPVYIPTGDLRRIAPAMVQRHTRNFRVALDFRQQQNQTRHQLHRPDHLLQRGSGAHSGLHGARRPEAVIRGNGGRRPVDRIVASRILERCCHQLNPPPPEPASL